MQPVNSFEAFIPKKEHHNKTLQKRLTQNTSPVI